jgi:Lon protease-like protein
VTTSARRLLPQLPLFPLQTPLFPGGLLPLRIFEVRYLDMIGRCHKDSVPFGVVALSEGSEVRRPGTGPSGDGFAHEAFHPVGTLASIVELRRPQAGLMLIRCVGTQRFRVARSVQQRFGLWVADVELLESDAEVPVPGDLAVAGKALEGLLHNIRRSIADSGEPETELPISEPYRWNDCGWLANRWCELLPLDTAMKQRLMALDSPVLRLELVADLLGRMGVAGTE